MPDKLASCLQFAEDVFARVPPKQVLLGSDDPLAVIYSDAAFGEGRPITFGRVLFLKDRPPRAGAGSVPAELSAQFKERKTQISIGGLLGALSALHTCGQALRATG